MDLCDALPATLIVFLKNNLKIIWRSRFNRRTFAVQYRGMEQLVARRAHNPKVVGSSPAPATKQKVID